MAWHPIESAPKDRPIIILCPGDRMAIAKWETDSWLGPCWAVRVPSASGWGVSSDTIINFQEDQPTRWMVTPDLP